MSLWENTFKMDRYKNIMLSIDKNCNIYYSHYTQIHLKTAVWIAVFMVFVSATSKILLFMAYRYFHRESEN